MPARVQRDFPVCSADAVLDGHACRGVHVRPIADAMNWLNGHGQHLIASARWDAKTFAIGSTKTFNMQLQSRIQATHRAWRFLVTSGQLTFTDPSGGTSTWGDVYTTSAAVTLEHIETITSRADGPVAVSITIANAATAHATAVIDGIACFELQRRDLDFTTTDDGIDADSIVTLSGGVPAPILDADAYVSIGALSRGMSTVRVKDARTLFEWFTPSGDGFSTTSAAYVPVFEEGPVLLGSKLFRTSTTATATVFVYYRTGATTAGTLRVTMVSGATATLSLPAATGGAWLSTTIDIDCEDPSDGDGRRMSRDDVCTIELLRTSGANAVSVESISIVELRT